MTPDGGAPAALTCQRCGAVHDPGLYPRGCPDCRERGTTGRLEVEYDPGTHPPAAALPVGDGDPPASMWDYRALLPLVPEEPVTVGEGGTPLTRAEGLSADTGARAFLKNETVNPTWSYKDRLNALLLSNAAALGADRVAVASTGNHGASTAAYAARAGVDATVVLLPHGAERPVRAQARSYGATVAVTDHDARGDLLAALVDRGWYPTVNVADRYVGQPYTCEAYATVAFELVDQLGGVPDAVAVAAGASDGLYGVWKGFRDLRALGVVEGTPRMLAAEPAGRAPLSRTLRAGDDGVVPDEGERPRALSVGGATTGAHGLRALRESGGTAVAVDEADMARATRATAGEGVLPEPASALAPAAVRRAAEAGDVAAGETVVAVVSGAGVKWPGATTAAVGEVPEIEPTLDALDAVLAADSD